MKKMLFCLFLLVDVSVMYAQEENTVKSPDTSLKMELPDNYQPVIKDVIEGKELLVHPSNRLEYHDFEKIYKNVFSEYLSYLIYTKRTIMPGLMVDTRSGGEATLRFNESFSLTAGGYAMQYVYNFGLRPYYDGVVYLDLSYHVTSWLTVGTYGQHSFVSPYNAAHGSILPSPFIPHSAYGVHTTAMFNQNFGITGYYGMEYNPLIDKRGHQTYGISPVINLNSLFK